MTNQAYWVYVLWSPSQRCFYIGISEDPDLRLTQHNAGASKWTKGKGPWQMIWRQATASLTAARNLENLLKRQKGGAGFFQLTGLVRENYSRTGSYSRSERDRGFKSHPRYQFQPGTSVPGCIIFQP